MTTRSVDRHVPASVTERSRKVRGETAGAKPGKGRCETELRAAARRHGLTMQELADRMGVCAGYLSQVATGARPWALAMREKAEALLGEVPAQGVVHRQEIVVNGGSRLHTGAGTSRGHEHAGSGGTGGGVIRLHDPGGPLP